MEPTVTFEEWLNTITQFDSDKDGWNVSEEITVLPPKVVASYLRRLLLNAPTLLQGITPTRLAHLIWFFNGIASSYWHNVRNKEVPKEEQIATIRAVGNFYRDFLNTYPFGGDQDEDPAARAVYMMWDMDCLEGAALTEGFEYLVEPCFEVLGIALRCKSYACQISALHGLGHLSHFHKKRAVSEIDKALKGSRLRRDLRNYALQARTGNIP